ncbi:MAG: hypothetical protein R3D60_10740 [Paracoccaceae bacterium]
MAYFFDMTAPGSIHGVEKPEWDEKYVLDTFGNLDPQKSRIAAEIRAALREGTRKVLPEEVPKLFVVEKPKAKWRDFFKVTGAIKVVREPVRELIERLDPGVHQFFPVTMRTKRGVVIEGPWFVIVITARQDSIVPGYRGKFISNQLPDGRYLLNSMVKHGQVPIDATRLSGLHLWREAKAVDGIFASDELIAELKANGLKTFPAKRAHLV